MLVNLHAEEVAQIAPMPPDFAPSFSDDGRSLRWTQRVKVGADALQLETGLRYGTTKPFHTRDQALVILREAAWHMQECARLGWSSKLEAFRHDRHRPSGRTVSVPLWKPPAEQTGGS